VPDSSAPPSRYSRDESEAARLDRNYGELLQELRVAETGVQLLFAFLLSIAFQQRFIHLTTLDRTLYLISLVSAAVAALLFIAPASAHRLLFRRNVKDELVRWTSILASCGLLFLLLAMLGSIALIMHVVSGALACIVVTAVLGVAAVWVWYLHPFRWRQRSEAEPPAQP
jgi:hypothetical protein